MVAAPDLEALAAGLADLPSRALFARDPGRFEALSFGPDRHGLEGLLVDVSKQRITEEILNALLAQARALDVAGWRDRLFAGKPINETEGRAVLHPHLRARPPGRDVARVLARMTSFAEAVRRGERNGVTGKTITDVVNIGIGGSDLGPRLAVDALGQTARPRVHFAANVDAADLLGTLAPLDQETTLIIVVSKSFSTEETLTNAQTAEAWLTAGLGAPGAARHMIAVTANDQAAAERFGIDPADIFPMASGVGGRFSLWSAVGLGIALALGAAAFNELLAGGQEMDRHFQDAPEPENLPLLMALVGHWNVSHLGIHALAVLPYDHRLRRLPDHLQQLEMESNGKGVKRDGKPVEGATCPVVFGMPGTLGQHAFYQRLHQGPDPVAADFIAVCRDDLGAGDHREKLLANCLAQSQALMQGRTADEARAQLAASGMAPDAVARLVPHLVCPGSRPSTTIMLDDLTPKSLGRLLALYEHKVFVQGVLWGVNPFDQWGVELGKQLSAPLLRDVLGAEPAPEAVTDARTEAPGRDGSTAGLLRRVKAVRREADAPARPSTRSGVQPNATGDAA